MIYFFASTRKSDKVSQITIVTTCKEKAVVLAAKCFIRNGYKGVPKMLAV